MQTGKYRRRAQKHPLAGGLSPGVERENEASKLKHVYGLPYYIMCLVPAFTVTSLEFVQHWAEFTGKIEPKLVFFGLHWTKIEENGLIFSRDLVGGSNGTDPKYLFTGPVSQCFKIEVWLPVPQTVRICWNWAESLGTRSQRTLHMVGWDFLYGLFGV